MGMAASQARFLGLTARKTNVEFEGQQINQQRTTLSNESANYYNSLLGMSVPVAPSVDEYTKTVYSFNDGALTNEITSMIAQPNGKYMMSYLSSWQDDFSVVSASSSVVHNNNGVYTIGSKQLRQLGSTVQTVGWEACTAQDIANLQYLYYDENAGIQMAIFADGKGGYQDIDGNPLSGLDPANIYMYLFDENESNPDLATKFVKYENGTYQKEILKSFANDDLYLADMSEKELQELLKEEEAYLSLLKEKYGDDDYYVRYIQNTTTGEYVPYFYKAGDLENTQYDNDGYSKSNINCYTIGSEQKSKEVKAIDGCKVEMDSSGRMINISIPNEEGGYVTYALTTSTITDQEAYDDAMNQYEYDKYLYDQSITEINAKIEIIQSEDKNLELRLKQLDTEQEAIQTEMDAVSKVIEKNTQDTFKTFG